MDADMTSSTTARAAVKQRKLSGCGAFQKHARNQQPVDFVRALENPIHARVAVIAFDWIFRAVAISSVDLNGLIDDEIQDLAAEDFQNRALDRVFFDGFEHLRRIVDDRRFPERRSIRPAVRYTMPSATQIRIAISASLCLIAPKLAIGFPNAIRCFAYWIASLSAVFAPPTAPAPSFARPMFRMLNAT